MKETTEAKDRDQEEPEEFEIELFNEKFEGEFYSFIIDKNRKIHMTPEEIGKALEFVYPKRDVNQLIKRHADEFKDKIKTFPAIQSESPIMALNKDGILLVGMLSRQPKAKLVRKWILEIVNKYEILTSSLEDPIDQIITMSKIVTEMAKRYKRLNHRQRKTEFIQKSLIDKQKELDNRQENMDQEQRKLEEGQKKLAEEQEQLKLEQENTQKLMEDLSSELGGKIRNLPMTETHKEELGILVNELHDITSLHHGIIWNKVHDKFNIPKPIGNRTRISLALDSQFEEIKQWLEDWIKREKTQRTLDF